MALMNVYDKLVMGPDAGNNQGAIEKKWFKHVGELADESKAKVIVLYRTVPGEQNNCLVVGTKFLPEQYHNALMRAVESEGGQAENEIGVFLARQTFPDGTNMLSLLHNDNYIKKFKTKDIIMTYGPTDEGRMPLNKLNEMIAKDMGVKVSELAVKDDLADQPVKKETKKTDAKETAAKK
tara:strand:- start:988 stop:1527 length:540 start_codon:yes stop_codon:yes gene_type:complete